MTRTSAALLAALVLTSTHHTQAQTTKKTTKPATTAAKAAAPKEDAPIERPFHSLAELDQLTWWKMFNYIGGDAKTVYDETKSLGPKIEGTRWSYTLQERTRIRHQQNRRQKRPYRRQRQPLHGPENKAHP